MLGINTWTRSTRCQLPNRPDCVEALTFRSATKSGGNNTGPNCVEVGFAKAAASNPSGNCVEVGHAKADKSAAAGHCVEPGVARDKHTGCTPDTCTTPGINDGDVVVRDSKLGDASPLAVFTPEQWAAFVVGVIAGQEQRDGDDYLITDPRGTGIVLRYTAAEWDAFMDGCANHEFDYQLAAA
jgi:hypothetical protein